MTEEQIKYMAERFLGWKLPEDFSPDGGISFKRLFNEHLPRPMKNEPVGTNLFTYDQAVAMIRYIVDGMNDALAEKLEEMNKNCISLSLHESRLKACEAERDEYKEMNQKNYDSFIWAAKERDLHTELEKENEALRKNEIGAIKQIDELEKQVAELRRALEDLLCEISEPAWDDDRLRYSEHQITKGAIKIARDVLAKYGKGDK